MTSPKHGVPRAIKTPAAHQLRKLFQREIEGVSAKRAEQTESIARRDAYAYAYVPKDEDGQAFPAIWLQGSGHSVGAGRGLR